MSAISSLLMKMVWDLNHTKNYEWKKGEVEKKPAYPFSLLKARKSVILIIYLLSVLSFEKQKKKKKKKKKKVF